MRVRVRVTTSGSGFCGFCGSVSQTVDIAYFSRFWACGSLVVFWIARSALRVRNGKSRQNQCSKALIQGKCVSCARSALRARRLELRPRHPKNRKRRTMWFFGEIVVFCRLCGFLATLWFFAVFVVFWRDCGFCRLCGFWGELVDLRSTVMINGKPPKNLTPQSKSC